MTREERQEFVKILQAHAQTIAICEACATTTRDLAAEVGRGSLPNRHDLVHTVDQAEQVLRDLSQVREEVERLIAGFR
jgi:sulfur relay (sulfurtransferase) complex TusBCD TusD component (DsrE family)